MEGEAPPTGTFLFVDVRDLAKAHVDIIENPDAGSKRFFLVSGHFSNKQVLEIVKKNFPQYDDKFPTDTSEGDYPPKDKLTGFDNSRASSVLGIKYIPLEQSITDTAKSIIQLL